MPAVPRLSKETSIYKPDAIGDGISGAAQTATTYLTESAADGLMVHPSTDSTTGVKVTDSVDIMRDGVSTANFGGEDGDEVRVGTVGGKHVNIGEDSIDMMDGSLRVTGFQGTHAHETGSTTETDTVDLSIPIGEDEVIRIRGQERRTTSLADPTDEVCQRTLSLEMLNTLLRAQCTIDLYTTDAYLWWGRLGLYSRFVDITDPFGIVDLDDPGQQDTSIRSYPTLQLGDPDVRESTDSVSASNGTNTTVTSLNLPAGTWLITCSTLFASNSTGRRVAYVSDDSTVSLVDVAQDASVVVPAVSGGVTKTSGSAIVTNSSTTTYYARCWQNSGSALSVSAHLKAVRLT